MIDKTGNPSMRSVGSSPEQTPRRTSRRIMDRVPFCCLLFIGLLNPLLSLPVTDTGERTLQLPGEVTFCFLFFFFSSGCHSGAGGGGGGGRGGGWLKRVLCRSNHALKRGSEGSLLQVLALAMGMVFSKQSAYFM
jgi:hypothetical protein